MKKSVTEKEKELLKKIDKAKNDLVKLQEKQKIKIGAIACKYNLNELDNKILEDAFKGIAKENGLINAG